MSATVLSANSVKTLKQTQNTDPAHWPDLIISLSTNALLTEGCWSVCAGSLMPVPLRQMITESQIEQIFCYHLSEMQAATF